MNSDVHPEWSKPWHLQWRRVCSSVRWLRWTWPIGRTTPIQRNWVTLWALQDTRFMCLHTTHKQLSPFSLLFSLLALCLSTALFLFPSWNIEVKPIRESWTLDLPSPHFLDRQETVIVKSIDSRVRMTWVGSHLLIPEQISWDSLSLWSPRQHHHPAQCLLLPMKCHLLGDRSVSMPLGLQVLWANVDSQ